MNTGFIKKMVELTNTELNAIAAKWQLNMFDEPEKSQIFDFARAAIQAHEAKKQDSQEIGSNI